MPSIYRREEKGRKRSSWVISYKDASGQWKKRYARTKEEAELLRAELVRQSVQAAPPTQAPNITFSEYVPKFIEQCRGRDLAVTTIEGYEWALGKHIGPALGTMRLRAIHRRHIKDLLARKQAEGLSKDSRRLIRATLSVLFGDAVGDDILQSNPMRGIRRQGRKLADAISQAERLKRIRPMTYEQLDTFLTTASTRCSQRDSALFLTMADTGLRPGEAVGLQWPDVDYANRELHVTRAITVGRMAKLTKTNTARTVDVSERLAEALRRRQEEAEKEAVLNGRGLSLWMFPSEHGGPLASRTVSRRFRQLVSVAGLKDFTLYDLRHTFATHLLMERADLLRVAHQLGHSKPTTTLLYYAHWMPRGDKAHLDRMIAARVARRAQQIADRRGNQFSPIFDPQRRERAVNG